MEKEQRNRLQKATQDARRLLEEEFRSQLLQTYDIDVEKVRWAEEPGAHLQAEQRLIREKLIAWIEHKEAQINDRKEALLLALREMAFTALNRFVALKLMEARELVRPCVSGGMESTGFLEFTAVAQGLLADQESSYRLYLETIFEDVSRELRALFDPRDPASLLWPKRTALLELLEILNHPELAELWSEDETLGWVYQYFNGDTERKKMREESTAPRNSRELAVRNQFFTPRYVVEFLTDNTLGRIWYEMRQGDTDLKDRCRYLVRRPNEIWLQPGEDAPARSDTEGALSQEELLRQPVHIPHRELKDPREIRMLDPACGSMHFGLYAFDLYMAIYEDAWEIAQASDEQVKQTEAFASFADYVAAFASKALFLREVPKLILQYNIHGIDIDPRATQIARLTLWLRAQRAWQEQRLDAADRPPITRSNVVCAEPMPGERELLADFVDQQFPKAERGLVQQLLETIFDKMQLAGEAGSLLKIEEEIRDAIQQARREWQKLEIQQRDLFSSDELAALGEVGSPLNTDLQNLTKDFWVTVEERIYGALREYANQTESGGYQRRLFAEDAAQGFAFIDLCRKHYDAALMNPPFGGLVTTTKAYASNRYPRTWKDIYCAFVERGIELLEKHGFCGAITSSTFLNLSTLEDYRAFLLEDVEPLIFADLGSGVMDDAAVSAACSVVGNSGSSETSGIFFIEAKSAKDPAGKLRCVDPGTSGHAYIVTSESLQALPLQVFGYWLSDRLRSIFASHSTLETSAHCQFGLHCRGNDDRLFRCWWELKPGPELSMDWPAVKLGGDPEHFFRDTPYVLDWRKDGEVLGEIAQNAAGGTLNGSDFYFKKGLGYIYTAQTTFSVHPLEQRSVFTAASHGCFPVDPARLMAYLGFLNSEPVRLLLKVINPNRFFQSSYVRLLPVPELDDYYGRFDEIATAGLGVCRAHAQGDECSRLFANDWSTRQHGGHQKSFQKTKEMANGVISDLASIKACLDSVASEAYGLDESDIALLQSHVGASTARKLPGDVQLQDESLEPAASAHVSYLVGCAMGRWDISLVVGSKQPAALPDPFDPLPICPPGLLQNAKGLPAEAKDLPADYPLHISWSGVLVEDKNNPEDIIARVQEVIQQIWGESSDRMEQEAFSILGFLSLRDYFRKPSGFFADHLKRYSKSRRQAPIYWQLSAGSGSYSAWLYYHRFTSDTIYLLLRDFAEPRIQQAEREQFELESQGALSGDAATRLQEAQTLLQDLRILKSELDLVAPLWNPNLNDGVIINHAILWRITPFTPWQKKCKECWDKLVKGDYDWAHLAFHLWPERVIPKCTTDRSLAIAHGLEERLWQETNNGNWLPRQLSEAELQALINEHSKPAVKNALERFLAAPPPVASTRTRAPRATRSSISGTTRKPRGTATVVDAEATRQTLLALTAAPAEGLSRNAIAELLVVEAASLTAVIKQLKEGGQIEQLGAARGAKYRLTEVGRARLDKEEEDRP